MIEKQTLSKIGQSASQNPMRIDLELYYEAEENRFHPTENPSGKISMNVAENHLCWEMLRDRIQQVTRENDIPEWVASYTDPAGAPSFREATASFLSKFLTKSPMPAETLAFSGGATSVIEMTAFLLGNPGDTAVIPAPAYPVYSGDLGALPGLKRYDLQTHQELAELKSGVSINTDLLQKAKDEIEANGSIFRMLILTSPDNPTGMIYSYTQLERLADWCEQNEVHLIVNEIYGLSQIDISHPELSNDYPKPIEFLSFGKLMAERKSPWLHLWYSFSKDLGISGFRIGLLHSYHEALITGYRNAGLGHSISNYTQWVMQEVLKDDAFMEDFVQKSQKRLTDSYLIVVKSLRENHIPYQVSYGSLFVWMDLSQFLLEQTDSAQHDFWLKIYEETGVLLTPANGFGHQKKGLFRMVISGVDQETLKEAMKRLTKFFQNQS
ncbi:aminotransferase class I/II-fold pyridoxal phosphate-dependent enzyme [Algoriphagus hitonicola]|uniref:Aminotransferase n=1 Tax=Algoriphagus hitonicola TaxID=435880 RepID=A0A1I2NZ82_9BACT|nr:aminotransferase class I/II-fold pyridoxal phosphate-dependent enzyme [Algoriphagus hitonicola]SFG06786.1 1-aminocyclopropane-1-carboxylate synthase [Algoriphagus hitonicola]